MGGNALLQYNIKTVRYDSKKYLELCPIVIDKLSKYFYDVYIPRGYTNKNDYGDLDVIVSNKKYNFDKLKILKKEFDYDACFHNSNIYSINYGLDKKDFQIDIIFTKNRFFKTTCAYFDVSDLNIFMGIIARKLKVKYGYFGLKYQVMSEKKDKILDEIILSTDVKKIFEFLGFDYSKFKKGFDSLEDIFNYVINSKYFNKEYFFYKNLDSENRNRNKRRIIYNNFIKYIETLPENNSNLNLSKTEKLKKIFEAFPELELEKKIFQLKEKEKITNQIKEKFNGNLIMELIPELKDKALGLFIKNFKLLFKTTNEFNNFILNNNQEKINNSIKCYYLKN